jgi:hypothetical protein
MKSTTQLIGAGLLALAVAGLGGCFGNGDHNAAAPPPSGGDNGGGSGGNKPETVAFSDFVHAQFAAGVRNSKTAEPKDVNGIDFKFADTPDPHAYDDLFKSDGSGS